VEIAEGAVERAFRTSRFFENIEIMGQQLGIRQNVEAAAADAATRWFAWPEPGFGEF
jgi:hypothetical protein